ncbi:peptidylprolyl isomerase [Myxococcaceae bacterium GXIMD 01537]
MSPLRSAVSACLAAALLHAGCVRSVPAAADPEAAERARIADWEDRRSLGGGQLLALASGEGGVALRVHALRALARIQDMETLDTVLAALSAPEAEVREEAAFAAGELGLSWEPLPDEAKAKLVGALLAAEEGEQAEAVRLALLEALSKTGSPTVVPRLVERLAHTDDAVAGRAALSLGVAVRRGTSGVDVPLAPVVALLAPARQAEARYAAAYLLAVLKRLAARDALRSCVADTEPDVRALCAKGLGDVGGGGDVALLEKVLVDPVPRVAVEATRALTKLAAACVGPCPPADALLTLKARVGRVAAGESASMHPLLALAQQGPSARVRPVLDALRDEVRSAARRASGATARGDLMWLDCRLAAAQDRQMGALVEVLRCGDESLAARRLALGLREIAQSKVQGGADSAVPYLSHADARVRLAALEAVSSRPVPEAREPVRALLGGKDPVVAASAASAAGKLKDAEALPGVRALAERVPGEPDLAEPVAGALVALMGKDAEPLLRPWLAHPHSNVRRVAAGALTELTGQPVRAARVELPATEFRPTPAPTKASLTFRTSKGDVTVALDDSAPLTSGNLYTLAQKGYFNGVTFHRVVPDFVVQGGDPRGDGEGGPGYSIRCEMTRRPYGRGTLGMALSGKDTGGSQFFITHAPQPHLDGRYTAFGEVTRGMEVVDGLSEGDVILEVMATP